MPDESGHVDQPSLDEDPPRPSSSKPKWDWQTDAVNEAIGFVAKRRLAADDSPTADEATPTPATPDEARVREPAKARTEAPPAGRPRREPTTEPALDASRHDEFLSSPWTTLPARRVVSGDAPATHVPAPKGPRGLNRKTIGIIATAALFVAAAALYLTVGSSPGPKAGPSKAAPSTTHPATHHAVARINPKVISTFASLTQVMDASNQTVAAQLSDAGASPTLTQVTAAITPYATAIKNYEYELHFLAWPKSMNLAVKELYSQLETYSEHLQSLRVTHQATLSTWLAQLDSLGASTQTADNQVRHDLGLPRAQLFP